MAIVPRVAAGTNFTIAIAIAIINTTTIIIIYKIISFVNIGNICVERSRDTSYKHKSARVVRRVRNQCLCR